MVSFFVLGSLFLALSAFRRVDAVGLSRAAAPNFANDSSTGGLQDVFEVDVPLRKDFSGTSCQQVIVNHEFAASYGQPYVGTYSPPANCSFTTVILNMSIVSAGINYDRLGLLFLGDVEVWRTSTAMPTRTGIFWNVQKDVTVYDALLRAEQKVILSIDNIYDSVFTAAWNVTITALYYDDAYGGGALTPASTILPLSSRSSAQNASSVFTLPDDNATLAYALPRNAARAVVNVLASGNSNEEFWYTAVPSQFTQTFANATLRAHAPFREVQLLIDGTLAGVAWPFPIVYTGGINPALWVPVVGIDAYDVPAYQIDITPWLGVICDGAEHSFSLQLAGYDTESDNSLGTVNSNWLISGSVFVWVDEAGKQTTGSALSSSAQSPVFTLASNVTGSGDSNTSLSFTLTGQRILSHSATITTSSGPQLYSWAQNLQYSNSQYRTGVTAYKSNSTVYQVTTGSSAFSADSNGSTITNTFQYQISLVQEVEYPVDDQIANSSLYGALDRSLISSSVPILEYLTYPSGFGPSRRTLVTRQAGSAIEYWNNTYYEEAGAIDPAEGSDGQTEQWYSYSGPISDGSSANTSYGRYVKALDGFLPRLLIDRTWGSTISVPSTEPLGL